jgi:hypothetical protein
MRRITGLALCVLFLCGCTDNSGKTDVNKPGPVPESSVDTGQTFCPVPFFPLRPAAPAPLT